MNRLFSLKSDFTQVLRKHGFRPTEQELHQMIKNVDKNHQDGGGIDFDEFIELLVNHGRNLEDDIAKSFRMFDLDGDGKYYNITEGVRRMRTFFSTKPF